MLMKIFLLIATVAVAAAQLDSDRFLWALIADQCAQEIGLTPDSDPSQAEAIEGCITACTMKRLGTMNEDGYWAVEGAIKAIPKEYPKYEATIAAFRHCAKEIGKTDCETANLLRKCLLKESPCSDDKECKANSYIYLVLTSPAAQKPGSIGTSGSQH